MAVTDILTFSSASKRVIGPSGTLDPVAPKVPAWDWSSGRRRLLIEARPATKYGPYSEAVGGPGWTRDGATRGATSLGPDGTAGLSAIVEDTSTGLHRTYYPDAGGLATVVAAGEHWATQIVVKAGAGSRNVQVSIAAATLDPRPSVTVNPATGAVVSTSGSPGRVAVVPLSNGCWRIEITMTSTTTGYVQPIVYLCNGTATTYTGDGVSSIYVGYVNSEKVANAADPPSSYVTISATAAVTRIADDVRFSSAALALLTGSDGATLVVRGDVQMGAATGSAILAMWGTTDEESVTVYRNVTGNQLVFGVKHLGVSQNTHVIPDTETSIGVCAAFGPSGVRLSSKGSDTTTVAWTSGSPTMASILTARLGDRYGSDMSADMLIDEIVIWPFVGSTAAVQSQARVWA